MKTTLHPGKNHQTVNMANSSWCLQIALGTHPGKVRKRNEDAIHYRYPAQSGLRRSRGVLVIVSDGVGGQPDGDEASAMAVEKIAKLYYQPSATTPERCLASAIEKTNESIFKHFNSRSATTATAAVFHKDRLIIGHVGDSRAYWIHNERIQQLTTDHIVYVDQKNGVNGKLERALGHRPAVDIDFYEHPVEEGGCLLLVTDGVTQYIEDQKLLQIVTTRLPDQAVRDIIQQANDAGGTDNMSAIVVHVVARCDESAARKHALSLQTKNLIIDLNVQAEIQPPRTYPHLKKKQEKRSGKKQSPLHIGIIVTVALILIIIARLFQLSNDFLLADRNSGGTQQRITADSPAIDNEIHPGTLIIFTERAAAYSEIAGNTVEFEIVAGQTYRVEDEDIANAIEWFQLSEFGTNQRGWIPENELPEYQIEN